MTSYYMNIEIYVQISSKYCANIEQSYIWSYRIMKALTKLNVTYPLTDPLCEMSLH